MLMNWNQRYGLKSFLTHISAFGFFDLKFAQRSLAETGGHTSLNGVESDNEQRNTRAGLMLALPIDRRNSLKLSASTGYRDLHRQRI